MISNSTGSAFLHWKARTDTSQAKNFEFKQTTDQLEKLKDKNENLRFKVERVTNQLQRQVELLNEFRETSQ